MFLELFKTRALLAVAIPGVTLVSALASIDDPDSEYEAAFSDVSVPREVILGCDAVCNVPVSDVAVKDPIAVIFLDSSTIKALLAIAVPVVTPTRALISAVDPASAYEAELIDVNVPKDVIFGWAAVCNGPVIVVAVKVPTLSETIPETSPELPIRIRFVSFVWMIRLLSLTVPKKHDPFSLRYI